MRILLVEDNVSLCQSLKADLAEAGYIVDVAYDGADGEDLALAAAYDAIILDIMLPVKDGLAVCRELRDQRVGVPVLMLTARDSVDDRVLGLDSGADDYLVKPFSLKELHARLRSLLRRQSPERSAVLHAGDLKLDPALHLVERGGVAIQLTSREFALLEYFMRNPNFLVSRDKLENAIWDYGAARRSNVIDVYMRRLRNKVDGPFADKLFETVRGEGYRLCTPTGAK
jgi:DNA-binding response OmpR family regulator